MAICPASRNLSAPQLQIQLHFQNLCWKHFAVITRTAYSTNALTVPSVFYVFPISPIFICVLLHVFWQRAAIASAPVSPLTHLQSPACSYRFIFTGQLPTSLPAVHWHPICTFGVEKTLGCCISPNRQGSVGKEICSTFVAPRNTHSTQVGITGLKRHHLAAPQPRNHPPNQLNLHLPWPYRCHQFVDRMVVHMLVGHMLVGHILVDTHSLDHHRLVGNQGHRLVVNKQL